MRIIQAMAGERTRGIEIDPIPGVSDEHVWELPEAEEQNENDITNVLADIGETPGEFRWGIQVYRVAPGKEYDNAVVLKTADISALETLPEFLRDRYNGGKFKIVVTQNGKFFRRRLMIVEPPIAPPVNATNNQQSDLARVIGILDRRMEAMENRLSAPVPTIAPVSRLAEMREMAEIMALMGNNRGGGIDAKEIFGFVKMGMEMGGGNSSEGGGGNFLDSAAKLFASPGLAPLLSGVGAAMAAKTPAPAIAAPSPQPAKQELPDMNFIQQQLLAGTINQLIGMAKQNIPVTGAADWVLENVPPAMVKHISLNPQLMQQAAQHFPEITTYQTWFTALLVELQTAISDVDPNAPGSDAGNHAGGHTGGPSGHSGDAQGNAPDSQGEQTQARH